MLEVMANPPLPAPFHSDFGSEHTHLARGFSTGSEFLGMQMASSVQMQVWSLRRMVLTKSAYLARRFQSMKLQ